MNALHSTDLKPPIVFQDECTTVTRYTADDIGSILIAPVPVSTNAAIRRINRRLSHDCEQLHVCRRDSPNYSRIGRYFLIDCRLNAVIGTHVDLAAFAQELGVFKQNERLGD